MCRRQQQEQKGKIEGLDWLLSGNVTGSPEFCKRKKARNQPVYNTSCHPLLSLNHTILIDCCYCCCTSLQQTGGLEREQKRKRDYFAQGRVMFHPSTCCTYLTDTQSSWGQTPSNSQTHTQSSLSLSRSSILNGGMCDACPPSSSSLCSHVYGLFSRILWCVWNTHLLLELEARGLKLKLLAYARRNGGRDKGDVGGQLRKCGGDERENV